MPLPALQWGLAGGQKAGAGQSAQVLAMALACTRGRLSSPDIREDPGRKCVLLFLWLLEYPSLQKEVPQRLRLPFAV